MQIVFSEQFGKQKSSSSHSYSIPRRRRNVVNCGAVQRASLAILCDKRGVLRPLERVYRRLQQWDRRRYAALRRAISKFVQGHVQHASNRGDSLERRALRRICFDTVKQRRVDPRLPGRTVAGQPRSNARLAEPCP